MTLYGFLELRKLNYDDGIIIMIIMEAGKRWVTGIQEKGTFSGDGMELYNDWDIGHIDLYIWQFIS